MKTKDLIIGPDHKPRCYWCADKPGETLYQDYHDNEWGRPVYNENALFEKLSLEGFQAGLSWITILKKRENFRAAFDNFDIKTIASYTEKDVHRLLSNPGIIRHRGKIEAVINNAQKTLELKTPLSDLIWNHQPKPKPAPKTRVDIPSQTPESRALSKELKSKGFKFIGPTTLYALMQSEGLVNDHLEGCAFRAQA